MTNKDENPSTPDKLQEERTEEAKDSDNSKLAERVTTSFKEWAKNPNRTDLIGVDTPDDVDTVEEAQEKGSELIEKEAEADVPTSEGSAMEEWITGNPDENERVKVVYDSKHSQNDQTTKEVTYKGIDTRGPHNIMLERDDGQELTILPNGEFKKYPSERVLGTDAAVVPIDNTDNTDSDDSEQREKAAVAELSVQQPEDDITARFDEPILVYGATKDTGDVFGDAVGVQATLSRILGDIPDAVRDHIDMRRSGRVGLLHIYEDGSWEFEYDHGENISGHASDHDNVMETLDEAWDYEYSDGPHSWSDEAWYSFDERRESGCAHMWSPDDPAGTVFREVAVRAHEDELHTHVILKHHPDEETWEDLSTEHVYESDNPAQADVAAVDWMTEHAPFGELYLDRAAAEAASSDGEAHTHSMMGHVLWMPDNTHGEDEAAEEAEPEEEGVSELEQAKDLLGQVRGIGDATAETLARDHGIISVDDLREELLDGNKQAWDALNKRFYDTMAVQLEVEPHDPPEDVGEFYFIEVPWSEPEDAVYDERQGTHVFVYTSDEYGYVRAEFTHFGPFIEYESEGSWQVALPVSSFETVRRKFPREDVNRAYMEFLELLATGRAMELLVGKATRAASAYDLNLKDGDVVQLDYSEGTDTVEITDIDETRFEATSDGETVVFGYHRITDDGVYGPLVYDHPDFEMVSKLYGAEVVESVA